MRERERRQRATRGRDRKIARTEVEGRERLARRVERPVVTREPPPGTTRPRREETSAETKPARPRRARPVRPGAASARGQGASRTPEAEPGAGDEGDEEDARKRGASPTRARPTTRARRGTRRPS